MIITPERRQAFIGSIKSVVQKRYVRWALIALVLVNFLILAVLALTVQLRWLPSPWPLNITRILFQVFLSTSVIDAMLFGPTGIASAVYLYRRRAAGEQSDPITIFWRAFIIPVIYILSILWGWSWLAGYSPRLFGAALVVLWSAAHTANFVYFGGRAFREAFTAAGNGVQTQEAVRIAFPAVQVILRRRMRKVRHDFRRRWWLLTHRDYIKRLPPPDHALFESVMRGLTQNVEVFLKGGADPNLRLTYGMPLIDFCASLGRTEAVRLLLDAGADINAQTPSLGSNALLNAASKGNLALVDLLIERGADIEASLSTGTTPLMLAAGDGNSEVVASLLEGGARKNATNATGMTALIFAVLGGHSEAVEALVDAGADLSIRTASGRTALDYAKKKGHQEMAEMLSQVRGKEECSEAVL